MGLADRLAAGPPPNHIPNKIDGILAELDPDDAAIVRKALHPDSGWSHAELAKEFTREGHPIADSTVGKWRRHNGTR